MPRPASPPNTRARLAGLLDEMIRYPDRREDLVRAVETGFGQEKAVMVLDMSGFSATTVRHGIVAFLLMIRRMQILAGPCIDEHGGVLIKCEGDDLFCLFDTAGAAVSASMEIAGRLAAANLLLPDEGRLYVSIGIGYGTILNVEDVDIFGSEVNLASKLGEDLGRMGDILLTPAACEALLDPGVDCRREEVDVAGLPLVYYRLDH